jgi:hypothetical protein
MVEGFSESFGQKHEQGEKIIRPNKSLHPTANRLRVVGVVTILHYSIDCPCIRGSG